MKKISWFFWQCFWIIQICISLIIVMFFSKIFFLKKRLKFEKKNNLDLHCQSFNKRGIRADCCFQFSSEGEWEQIRYLVETILKAGKKIELIFTSPSVEHRILALNNKNLRYLRMPLLDYEQALMLEHWITSATILCNRYDLFPGIMKLARKRKIILLNFYLSPSAAFSKKMLFFISLALFSKIYASSENEKKLVQILPFSYLNISIQGLSEFRLLSIMERMNGAHDLLGRKFSGLYYLLNEVKSSFPLIQRIIAGNFYPKEVESVIGQSGLLDLIKNKKIFFVVVPHRPEDLNWDRFVGDQSLFIYQIDASDSMNSWIELCQNWERNPGLIVIKGKGFLLELFSFFDFAIVGGGFFAKSHSVLEPFVSGAITICGRNTNHSTEFEYCKEIDRERLIQLQDLSELSIVVEERLDKQKDRGEFNSLVKLRLENQEDMMSDLLKEI